ncbi:MAG: hypothetical protein J6U54_25705 [Clostridiales bacterium]|nr:hypothetical protein [Clostridiales bacterium]
MVLTEKLIHYCSLGDSSIFTLNEKYEPSDYNIVCIFLFEWLKLEHKRFLWKEEGKSTSSKPLTLQPGATFTRLIPKFIEQDNTFHHSLKIDGDKLYYSEELSNEEIWNITKMAYDYYNPQINAG